MAAEMAKTAYDNAMIVKIQSFFRMILAKRRARIVERNRDIEAKIKLQ